MIFRGGRQSGLNSIQVNQTTCQNYYGQKNASRKMKNSARFQPDEWSVESESSV